MGGPVAAAAPLVEVPLGATLDRLVGSLDVRAALDGEHRVDAGLLARAHGGVLYVDEVNLLGDHLVDALLDAAAAGRVTVERDGVSVSQPARFLLVGTMNPEEGELRPQLLDRFGLGVEVAGPRDPRVRAEIVRRRMAFDADPAAFRADWAQADADVAARLAAARERLAEVHLPGRLLDRITSACARLDLDGIRGDLTCAHAARALAALGGASEVTEAHVARAAHLALRHRLRRDPLAPPPPPGGGDPAIDDALNDAATSESGGPHSGDGAGADGDARNDAATSRPGDPHPGDAHPGDAHPGDAHPGDAHPGDSRPGDDGGEAATGGPDRAPRWRPSPDLMPEATAPTSPSAREPGVPRARDAPGGPSRRDETPGAAARPAAVAARIPGDALTVRARPGAGGLAAVDARPAGPGEPVAALPTLVATVLHRDRRPRTAVTSPGRGVDVLLVVDASGSMAAQRRLARVKGAVEAALRGSYARRDRVAVVAFSGAGARTLVVAGTPLEQAAAAIAELPAGGRTPLADGLEHALALLGGRGTGGAMRSAPAARPGARHGTAAAGRPQLVLVLTDGRAADPAGRAARALARIVDAVDRAVVVDLEDGRVRLGLAADLAARAGADLTTLVTPDQSAPRRRAA